MKKVLIVLGSLLGLVVVLALVAPKTFTVEREILINKPVETVFPHLKSLKSANEWGPWAKRDPQIKQEFRGVDGTPGFVSSWVGNDEVGEGEQEIKSIVENQRVDSELRFKKPFENTAQTYFAVEAMTPTQTKVKWGMVGNSPIPYNVFCWVFNMKSMIAKDFDEGLNTLKTRVEN